MTTSTATAPLGPLLAIESSCDDTAVAILSEDGRVLADCIHSQTAAHAPFGGVVPELASREHVARIAVLMREAFSVAGLTPKDIRVVAATHAPGLIGSLLVGLMAAKGFAQARRVPLVGVHHLEGHLMAASLDPTAPKPPFVGLVASGGHTAIYRFLGVGQATLLGQTRDDAAGEAFDKTAKLLQLGYPGGAVIDKLAEQGDPTRFVLPISLKDRTHYDFSFSGLKTAVRLLIEKQQAAGSLDDQTVKDICAGVRKAIVDALVHKTILACRRKQLPRLVLGGGVAANSLLRSEMLRAAADNDIEAYVPPRALCTDNAVMIAMAARAWLLQGKTSTLSLMAQPDLAIEQSAEALC